MGAHIGRISNLIGLGLYAVFIYEIVRLWIAPELNDAERVLTLTIIALFEMIVIHVSVVLVRLKDWTARFSAIGFYTLFAIAFSFGLPNNTILFIYLGVVASRVSFILSSPTQAQIAASNSRSALSAILYLVGIFATVLLGRFIPEFGLDEAWMQATNYISESDSGGLYIEAPHLALAFASFYFSCLLIHDAFVMFKRNTQNRYTASPTPSSEKQS